jgi:hypothetical protein
MILLVSSPNSTYSLRSGLKSHLCYVALHCHFLSQNVVALSKMLILAFSHLLFCIIIELLLKNLVLEITAP